MKIMSYDRKLLRAHIIESNKTKADKNLSLPTNPSRKNYEKNRLSLHTCQTN